jgi:hypothetical protein
VPTSPPGSGLAAINLIHLNFFSLSLSHRANPGKMVHRVLIAHEWRIPRLMVALLITELPLTVLCLVLMGIADPNTYRTKLWADGGKAGLNSNPNIILYSYANYKPLEPPLVWSQ